MAIAALALCCVALSEASPGSARREPVTTCAYDPATRVVTFNFATASATRELAQPYITRDGAEIVFEADFETPLSCAGGTPTVTNTDRIDLTRSGNVTVLMTLELNHGPLAPGATAEAGRPEIEIESYLPDFELEITPSDKAERFNFGAASGTPMANLNAAEGASEADADIVFHDLEDPGNHGYAIAVATYSGRGHSNRGDDTYAAGGGPGVGTRFPYNVLLVGGKGRDRLFGGNGGDTLYGGEDPDLLLGGRGRDRINSLGAQHDVVDCGSDRDRAESSDNDIVRNCETIAHSN